MLIEKRKTKVHVQNQTVLSISGKATKNLRKIHTISQKLIMFFFDR
jgi:hypothetical protein